MQHVSIGNIDSNAKFFVVAKKTPGGKIQVSRLIMKVDYIQVDVWHLLTESHQLYIIQELQKQPSCIQE